MKILVINSGSSSIKYQLIDMTDESVLAVGLVERIGIDGARLEQEVSGHEYVIEQAIPDHEVGMELVIAALTDEENGVISSVDEIDGVGHRVVQGGKFFDKSVLVDDDVKAKIKECAKIAPLHNPAHLMGINVCEELMPETKQVVTFDSAFHQSMPEEAYMYALPYKYYEKYDIRRYGAHGTSHKYVAQLAAEQLGKAVEETKIITCHLGNGASITAVKSGKSYDTSMGLTPLEGLVMGTRCGDIDPAAIPYIMEKEDLSPQEMDDIMNNESGFLGITGISNDTRDIEEAAEEGNQKAQLALKMFSYRAKKYIGSYVAAMNGVDAVVFTAGIGENGIEMREDICQDLDYLGIKIDTEKNNVRGKLTDITAADSKVKVYVIPTNEELVIARDTLALVAE
ncbi:acetate/propionate family kinase [Halanaerobium salsuginis]|uniref:Acetate kinase n=1 Tax=Halanaerobium salsuginis TaxID=29563 RepID=A0A1I4EM06_9FIRM|nr:acetate kinase [Halanaerobium salsuginis]SFL06100.1 acetate kinase [Halanaerobium salsuginis]